MIRNAIQRLMYGRYGNDQLNLFLMGLYLLLYLVFIFVRIELLYWVGFALLFITLFRMLSRNIPRPAAQLDSPAAYHPPGQGACLLQMPRLRPAAARSPGQGQDYRHLPRLRRQLSGKKLNSAACRTPAGRCVLAGAVLY